MQLLKGRFLDINSNPILLLYSIKQLSPTKLWVENGVSREYLECGGQQLYNTVVKLILLYGCETWKLYEGGEKML